MHYRAVGNRCAVHIPYLGLQISENAVRHALESLGFTFTSVDVVTRGREYLNRSLYVLGARMSRAPNELDCSSLTKWAYAQKGVWLPRLSVQQCQIGEQVDERQMRAGDLVFTEGLRSNFIVPETRMTVGHVGITTSEDTVLHAAYKERTVTETPYKLFAKKGLRTIRRIIPEHSTYTVIVPQGYEIETSDDLRWLILRKLK